MAGAVKRNKPRLLYDKRGLLAALVGLALQASATAILFAGDANGSRKRREARAGDARGPTNAPHTAQPPAVIVSQSVLRAKGETTETIPPRPTVEDPRCTPDSHVSYPMQQYQSCVLESPQARHLSSRNRLPGWGAGQDRTSTIATRLTRMVAKPTCRNAHATGRP